MQTDAPLQGKKVQEVQLKVSNDLINLVAQCNQVKKEADRCGLML